MSGRSETRTFFVVWSGQLVSLVGSNLTAFGLSVWVYLETGSVTQLAVILLASQLPQLVVTPVAGALVDRWDRRWAMILSDTGVAVGTLAIAVLFATGNLETWNLTLALAFSGVFQAFQWPAYSAAITLLIPKAQYGRAAGLVQLADALGQVAGPVLAGLVLVASGIGAILVIDVVTFLVAVTTLLMVRFPTPERSEAGEEGAGNLLQETLYGFRYLGRRHALLALLGYFALVNLVFGFIGPLFIPLILSFAGEAALGTVFSVAATGMLVGSLIASAWGGPKRKVAGLLAAGVVLGIMLMIVGWQESLLVITVAGWFGFAVVPSANAASQAIWQAKVEPDVQGRVFAVRRLVSQGALPLAYLLVGPLADNVLEPLMAEGGGLADLVGPVIGTGTGRGYALFFVVLGVVVVAGTIVAWLYPPLRHLERDLPDAVPDRASPVEL